MSETSSSFPPPPPMLTPSGNILGRNILNIHRFLRITSIVLFFANVALLIALINQYLILRDIQDAGSSVSSNLVQRATDSDQFISVTNTFFILTFIAFQIGLMVWCNKTTKNLRDSGYVTEKSSGWAVGSFFIPILNFVFVYQTFKDLLNGLSKFFPQITQTWIKEFKAWWILMIIGSLVLRTADSNLGENPTIGNYVTAAGVQAVGAVITLIGLGYSLKAFKQLRDDVKS